MNLPKKDIKKYILVGLLVFLVLITLVTPYYGSTDIGDYGDVAKYFAGDYSAKIRSSHSYMYGILHSFLVGISDSFIFFKITSLIFLGLIVYSVYIISGKRKETLLMMMFLPIVWYIAPWISPIQISSLFLLWSYYFMKKYQTTEKISNLIYSGSLIGFGWVFWDTTIYFGAILGITFLYNKKVNHAFAFVIGIFFGLIPRLIADQIMFNFAFFTTVKTFIAGFVSIFAKGIYAGSQYVPNTFMTYMLVLLAFPIGFWMLYKKKYWGKYKKDLIFLGLSVLLILTNPQIRYVLAIAPIIIILIAENIEIRESKIQKIVSFIVLAVFVLPYILQIGATVNNSIYGVEISVIARNPTSFSIGTISPSQIIVKDINDISKEYPNQNFVVGNDPDDYQTIAHFYWGKEVKELVSIQDYELYISNKSVIFERKFEPVPNVAERRQFWIEGGLKKNTNDKTDYENITLAIGLGEPIKLDGFKIIKKYDYLYLSGRDSDK